MKCPYCGGALTLEDRVCPFCGRDNEQGKAFAAAKEHLTQKHDTAAEKAAGSRRLTLVVIVQGVIFACLLIGILYTYHYRSTFYHRESERRSADALEHADVYVPRIEAYLAAEDYMSLSAFVGSIGPYYLHTPYEPYMMVIRLANSYTWLAEELMNVPYGSHEVLEKWGEIDRPDFASLGRNLYAFFECSDPAYFTGDVRGYAIDEDLGLYHASVMKEDLYALLRTYLHAKEDQIDAWKDYPAERIAREMEDLYDAQMDQ